MGRMSSLPLSKNNKEFPRPAQRATDHITIYNGLALKSAPQSGASNLNDEILGGKLWKIEVSECIVLIMVAIHSVVFSYYTIMKYYSFRSYAWDLGIIVQSLANTAKGNLFINNVELYYSSSHSYFGVHFSPIYFLVVPFFFVAPKVETILVMQSVVLGLSAVPVFLLARHSFNDRPASLLVTTAYLLNPLLQGLNWYHFNPETFLPLLFLSATYFFKKRRFGLFLMFVVLSLMTFEQAAYFVMMYAIYVAWEVRDDLRRTLRSKHLSLNSLMPLAILVGAFCWSLFAAAMIHQLNPNPPSELKAVGNFALLGISDLSEIPGKIITSPGLVFNAIRFEFFSKLLYVLLTFAPTAFLGLLSPIALLPALSWVLLSFLSNHSPYYQLGFQYTALTLPFVTIASIEAIQKLPNALDTRSAKMVYEKLSILLLISGIVLSAFASPISPLQKPYDYTNFRDYGVTFPSILDKQVMDVLNSIPKNATIFTTPTIFPYISTYPNAYVIPPINSPSTRLFESNLKYLQTIKYDYILISSFWDRADADLLYNVFISGSKVYSLLMKGAGLELYKRGYKLEPVNVALEFSYKELSLGGSMVVDDASSESGRVVLTEPKPLENRVAWYGPYVAMVPGHYTIQFRIKVDRLIDGKILKLDIWSNNLGKRLGYYDVRGADFNEAFTWHTFTVPLQLGERVRDVEFRGLEVTSDVGISLDYIEVVPNGGD
jgi:uncharacterized membrane protein